MFSTISFITSHPLTRDRPLAALSRFARWQVESRLKREILFDWIDGARLVVRNGMTGATGNIYCGLHEFADMAFVLHFLRPDDLFIDVGANVGTYTVLASTVCGARSIAVEPDPETMNCLKKNIAINALKDRVCTIEAALGPEQRTQRFTVGLDTVNRMARPGDTQTQAVQVRRLDDVLAGKKPTLIKLDVEGFEPEVLAGAQETLEKPSLLAIESECNEPTVASRLINAGFEQVFYDPFSHRFSQTAAWHQNNALYVRNREACEARLKSARRFQVLHHHL